MLELAERACGAAEGDEADALVQAQRSGFARFADSVVHQPTLIVDESVTVRVVREGRVGCATTNRTDDEGLA
ncbi:MAG TPA: DNA gyrase modulator, partial [Gaiellaceae bacterium]|nr:DNA gyrase modulator [Gaiellaceae bacterium]